MYLPKLSEDAIKLVQIQEKLEYFTDAELKMKDLDEYPIESFEIY